MKEKLVQINDNEWDLPKSSREDMNVKGKLFANKLIYDLVEDEAINQLANVACMPGVIEPVIALPDAHFGYGLPMGAVAAFDSNNGVISSGLCGFDINCGINSIATNLTYEEIKPKLKELIEELFKKIPCGVGAKGKLRLTREEIDDVLVNGVNFAASKGYGTKEDILATEEEGCMKNANANLVSDLAKKRGLSQLGTLGAGNHFLEIQKISKIYDKDFANKHFMKKEGQVMIMLHCGSRGLGHQVATDYLKIHEEAVKKYNIKLPDRQLACAPVNSKEAQDYFSAMKCAVNYAFTNRLVMTHWIREVFEKVFKKDWQDLGMHTVYAIAHNIVKLENINGKDMYIHRKGATRAYPNKPVIIAGSMGTASYICKGTDDALVKTFGSSCHGAGRVMSRNQAIKTFRGGEIQKDLANVGIISKSPNISSLAEEAPLAYKDVVNVVNTVHDS
ncbi:MAG: RtcB family protein, partial [Candidatus Woesearchaeota archaeon]